MTAKPDGPTAPGGKKGAVPGQGEAPVQPPAPTPTVIAAESVAELSDLRARYDALTQRCKVLEDSCAQLQADAQKLHHIPEELRLATGAAIGLYRAMLLNMTKLRREGGQPINAQLTPEEKGYLLHLVNEGGVDIS